MGDWARRSFSIGRLGLACVALGATVAAAAAAGLAPEADRGELLMSPLWLGLPLIALCAAYEWIARTSRSALVSFAALATLLPSLYKLDLAVFMTPEQRSADSWSPRSWS